MKKTMAIVLGSCLMGAALLEAGWNYRRLDNISLITATYFDYSYMDRGIPVYQRGEVLKYRVTLTWEGKKKLKNYPIEAGLYWAEDTVCGDTIVKAGDPLPDSYRSGIQLISMSRRENTDYFDVAYMIPNTINLCPNTVEIHLDSHKGRAKNISDESFVVRERFRIE